MKLLILGAKGLLGGELQKVFSDNDVLAYDREELDVTDFSKLRANIINLRPDIIINCVAWNDVDGAEAEKCAGAEGGLDRAKLLNCDVPKELAEIAKLLNIIMVTYSTDHVFGGEQAQGYAEDDAPNPVNAYGESKYCGERAVDQIGGNVYLIRTSRLYGPPPLSLHAKKSFPLIMIDLAKKQKEISVVNEELGAFTYAHDLAKATRVLLDEGRPYGIYHLTNSGIATWYECANEIFNYLNILTILKPVKRDHFSRPAKMPKNSIMLNTKFSKLRDWREALHEFLDEYKLKIKKF